jgi:hypothetical protein
VAVQKGDVAEMKRMLDTGGVMSNDLMPSFSSQCASWPIDAVKCAADYVTVGTIRAAFRTACEANQLPLIELLARKYNDDYIWVDGMYWAACSKHRELLEYILKKDGVLVRESPKYNRDGQPYYPVMERVSSEAHTLGWTNVAQLVDAALENRRTEVIKTAAIATQLKGLSVESMMAMGDKLDGIITSLDCLDSIIDEMRKRDRWLVIYMILLALLLCVR